MSKNQCFKRIRELINQNILDLQTKQMLGYDWHHIGFFYFCLLVIAYRCGYTFTQDRIDNDKQNIAYNGLSKLGLLRQDYYYDVDTFGRDYVCHLSSLGELYFEPLHLSQFFDQHIDKHGLDMCKRLVLKTTTSKNDAVRDYIENHLVRDMLDLYHHVLEDTQLLNRNHLVGFLLEHHVHIDQSAMFFLKHILCHQYKDPMTVDPLLFLMTYSL